MIKNIVVGTDGSPTAEKAVREAAELAAKVGGQVHLVSAYTRGRPASEVRQAQREAPEDVAYAIDDKGDVEDRLEEAAKVVKEVGAEVDTHAIKGEPADVIIELAEREQADLIVVGNKGMTGAKRFVLGSVPNAIAHHAPCNVLIVRTT